MSIKLTYMLSSHYIKLHIHGPYFWHIQLRLLIHGGSLHEYAENIETMKMVGKNVWDYKN